MSGGKLCFRKIVLEAVKEERSLLLALWELLTPS